MTRKFAIILLAVPLLSQTWTQICDGSGSTCGGSSTIRARGFMSKLPYDAVNGVFLYWGGTSANAGIYSNAIWAYNSVSHTFTKTVDNGGTATANCAQQGSPYDTYNPILGHPQGYIWSDGTYAYMTNQLCGGQFNGFTNRYTLSTQTMTTRLSVAPFGTGDGTFNATGANFQAVQFAPNVGKAFYCCWNGGGGVKFVEFNGSTYTDKTSSLTGDSLPAPWTAFALVYLNGYLWAGMGCNGTSPGNGSINACSGTKVNDLYRIDPSTYAVAKIAPVGAVKPTSTNSSYPFLAADTTRNRILLYAGTDDLWQYVIATNTWSQISESGGFSLSPLAEGGDGNLAAWDSTNDQMIFMYSLGQSTTPAVYNLSFGGIPPASILSGGVNLSGGATIR